jgi:hypothetical protein
MGLYTPAVNVALEQSIQDANSLILKTHRGKLMSGTQQQLQLQE